MYGPNFPKRTYLGTVSGGAELINMLVSASYGENSFYSLVWIPYWDRNRGSLRGSSSITFYEYYAELSCNEKMFKHHSQWNIIKLTTNILVAGPLQKTLTLFPAHISTIYYMITSQRGSSSETSRGSSLCPMNLWLEPFDVYEWQRWFYCAQKLYNRQTMIRK